jgi:glycosyltransferase involved in cell wall biosynthesis
MQDKILVVIPALNEEKTIGEVVSRMRRALPTADVLVVDGYSTDQTVGVARSAGAVVMQVAKSLGIGGAVETAILYAHRQDYDCLVRIDADGQHPPEEVLSLVAALRAQEADLVIGSRFLGKSDYQPNLLRRSSIALITALLRIFYRAPVTDCTSGCQLMSRALISSFARDMSFEYSEVRAIWMARKAGFRIVEKFINMAPRQAGTSSFSSMVAFLYMFKNLVDILLSVPVFLSRGARR